MLFYQSIQILISKSVSLGWDFFVNTDVPWLQIKVEEYKTLQIKMC